MGIKVTSNFDEQSAIPLDSRSTVATTADRDALVAGIRYEGMLVYVESVSSIYMLRGGLTNGYWTELADASGSNTRDVYYSGSVEPISPIQGDVWFHTDTGILYYRVSDGVDEVWLDVTGTGSSSGTGTVYDDTDVVKAPLGVLPTLDGSNLTNLPTVSIVRHIGAILVEKNTSISVGSDIIGAIEIPFDATITEIRAKTASGTATVVFNNAGLVIGNVNATSSGVSNTVLSNTVIGVWDDLTIDVSSASGSGLAITIILQES